MKKTSIITDILLLIILGVLIALSAAMILSGTNGGVPRILGHSVVTVKSGSMQASNFNIDERYLIKKVDTSSLAVGDVIAFYYCTDPKNPAPDVYEDTNRAANKELTPVIMHEIVRITTDAYGTSWFTTKGSSNQYEDVPVRHDFIIGKYVPASAFVSWVINTLYEPRNLLLIILLPCSLAIIIYLIELLKLVEISALERNVLKGKLALTDTQCRAKHIGRLLPEKHKQILFAKAADDEKQIYADILWDKKKQKKLNIIIEPSVIQSDLV